MFDQHFNPVTKILSLIIYLFYSNIFVYVCLFVYSCMYTFVEGKHCILMKKPLVIKYDVFKLNSGDNKVSYFIFINDATG